MQEDRQGVHIFSAGTFRDPDLNRRVRPEYGNDHSTKGLPEAGVVKKTGLVMAKRPQELLHAGRFMQHFLLVPRQGLSPLCVHALPNPAFQGLWGIVAEIETITVAHAFEQQAQLRLLDQRIVRGLHGTPPY